MPENMVLHVLTPTLVSDGNRLDAGDYLLVGRNVYVLNPEKVLGSFSELERRQYLAWCEPRIAKLEGIEKERVNTRNRDRAKQLQRQATDLRKELALSGFLHCSLQINQNNTNRLNDWSRYMVRSEVNQIRSLDCFIKDGLGRPYFPGSTVKGFFRTALLYKFLREVPDNLRNYAGRYRKAGVMQKT